jgi:RimJ/RimL family protein N-acetyltransferase
MTTQQAIGASNDLSPAKQLTKAFARLGSLRMARLRGRASPTVITIRAVRPDDRERIVKAFRALDPESVRQRFFVPKKALSGEELRRLTESDGVRDVVLVATVAGVDQEIIVGLGRYARNGTSAEIAFTVEEDYQRRGISTELLRQLTDIARRSGVLRFEADVLPDNAAMLKVFQRSGLPMKAAQTDGIVHLTLSLDDGFGNP